MAATDNDINNVNPGWQRDTGHNPDAAWISTYRPIWNAIMSHDYGNFDSIAETDLVGDNSILLMSTFATRCSNNPPISRLTGRPYSSDTLKQAIGKFVQKFREKFGDTNNERNFFPQEQIEKWKRQVARGRSRTMMEQDGETELFKNLFPIPQEHSIRTRLLPLSDFTSPNLRMQSRNVDMLNICRTYFGNGSFTEWAKVLLTFKAIGRGGEIKFLSYKRMFFDLTYGMLFTQWFQRKSLKSTPIGFVPEYKNPETCIFLALGCYWACDGGLSRDVVGDPGTPINRKSAFVFQDLHDIRDASVAGQIGNIIKSAVPADLISFYSVKSLRYGAMSQLSWDPAVAYEEAVALGGWTTDSNSSWYTWTYLIAIIPAVLCLADYPDARVLPYLPNCRRLSLNLEGNIPLTEDGFQSLVRELFSTPLREFHPPNGRLWQLLVTVTSVMIMRFQYLYNKYGGHHRYVTTMVNAVRRAELARDQPEAIQRLDKWSAIVKKDFVDGTMQGDNEHGNVLRRRNIQDQLAKMNLNVSNMLSQLAQARAEISQNTVALHSLETKATQIVNQNSTMLNQFNTVIQQQQQIINLLQNGNAVVHGTVNGGAPSRPPDEHANTVVNEVVVHANDADTHAGTHALTHAGTHATMQRNVQQVLLGHSVNQGKSRKRGEQKKEEQLQYIFRAMHEDIDQTCFGAMISGSGPALEDHATWVHTKIFAGRRNTRNKIEIALRFVDAMWTKEERQKIITRDFPDTNTAINYHKKISRKVVEAVHILKNPKPKKVKPAKQAKDGLLGLANNIQTWKEFHKLPKYVPDWNNEGAVEAAVPLTALMQARVNEVAMTITNPYRRNRNN